MEYFLLALIIYFVYKELNQKVTMNKNGTISNNNLAFNFDAFGYQLGMSESSNNYQSDSNGIAYGYYQFIPTTIDMISKELNLPTPSIQDFLNNPTLQDTYYKKYASDILNYIHENMMSYIGQNITGKTNGINTTVNIYGLVAGAWLGGDGNLYRLFYTGYDANDGSTYISDYVAKFSNLFNTSV